jgi:hypothetical protein
LYPPAIVEVSPDAILEQPPPIIDLLPNAVFKTPPITLE